MKKNVFVVFAAVMLTLISCSKERITGNGSVITETRNINNFKSVSVSGSTNVYITEGAVFKVEVKGYNNLLPYFETKLVNTTLELGYKENTNVRNDNTEVFITMPVLESLVQELLVVQRISMPKHLEQEISALARDPHKIFIPQLKEAEILMH